MTSNSDNVGIAFAVVIGAGLSTAVGAAVVFFPSLIQYANRKTLASGLGLSAGVMTYVSFVEIFGKSVDSFVGAEFLPNQAYFSATLCFFAGVILMICLNLVVHGVASHNLITKGQYGAADDSEASDDDSDDESVFQDEESHASSKKSTKKKKQGPTKADLEVEIKEINVNTTGHKPEPHTHHKTDEELAAHIRGPCCGDEDPVGRLEDLHDMARNIKKREEEQQKDDTEEATATVVVHPDHPSAVFSNTDLDLTDSDLEAGKMVKKEPTQSTKSDTSSVKKTKKKKKKQPSKKDKQRLTMMSLNTAVAIALHNFPEGLATFVATLQDPAVGAVLAVAIAIHNIPEGLCVAMPVYYATGNRWRAFCWGLVSGVSEPLAAFLGWVVLASWINDMAYAVLFGLVSGMMVVISVKELLPTAHRYDPADSCVTNMFILGMAIMAASLVLFQQL